MRSFHIINPVVREDNVAGKQQCNLQTQSNQHKHHFIHWCIPWSRYATRMSALQSCQLRTDIDFFRALKQHYVHSKELYKKILSFKKPIALRFVKASASFVFQSAV
jgi:hypothetical protein